MVMERKEEKNKLVNTRDKVEIESELIHGKENNIFF